MKVSIVIPAYNEEGNVRVISNRILEVLDGQYAYEIIFINDGSSDRTLERLKELNAENPNIHYISFSRNFGHQNALKAGIDYATGDCIISMDADMQHPPEFIPEMLQRWQEGYDIVYTKREEVKTLPYFKRKTSSLFYKLMNRMSDIEIEPGAADFRLVDRKVAQVLRDSRESNLFMRGFISWIGFRQYKIDYRPAERFSGTTKYTVKKMLLFAINGITSFSVKPLQFSIALGLLMSAGAFLYALYAIYMHFFTDSTISGWTSVLVSVLFVGGIQLFILGIIGEYIGKIFMQTKNRPTYIVRETDQGLNTTFFRN